MDSTNSMNSMDSIDSMESTRSMETAEDKISDAAAVASILKIPVRDVPQDPILRSRLLKERPGIVYGLHEVTDEGIEELGGKRVIYEHEHDLLQYVSPAPNYVGQTIQKPELRMTVHASSHNACEGVAKWHRELQKKKGPKDTKVRIAMVVIESNIPGDLLTTREREYIKKYNTLSPNGANMQLPGHRGDYIASEILVAKRHMASYNTIIKQVGDAKTLVKNILQLKKKGARDYYGRGYNDLVNWCRILSNNSEEEAKIDRGYEEAWMKLSWCILSHDPEYVQEFLSYCQTYSKRRAAWRYNIDCSIIYDHVKSWKKSTIVEVKKLAENYESFEQKLSDKESKARLKIRLPDTEQLSEVKYVLNYILQRGDTNQKWRTLYFKDQRRGHEWLAKWEADQLTQGVVKTFREEYAIKHTPVEITPEQAAEAASAACIKDKEDAIKLVQLLQSKGTKHTADHLNLSTDQVYRLIDTYSKCCKDCA